MQKEWIDGLVLAVMLVPSLVPVQQACTSGIRIDGTITDPTRAVIPGGQVLATSGERATTNATGHYLLPRISGGSTVITVQAERFSRVTARAHARWEKRLTSISNLPLRRYRQMCRSAPMRLESTASGRAPQS